MHGYKWPINCTRTRTDGEMILGHGVATAHYSQHSAEALPPEVSPLEYMAGLFPREPESALRNVLGSCTMRSHKIRNLGAMRD